MPGASEARGTLWDESVRKNFPSLLGRMQRLNTATYLEDDIFTKVNRTSLAVALEARVSLLNHRAVELAWRSRNRPKFAAA